MSTAYAIQVYPEMGRGLQALHGIKQGTLIKEEEVLLLSAEDSIVLNATGLRYYTFSVDTKRDCLVLGDGELYNHNDSPNTGYVLVYDNVQNRHKMRFYALCDIETGEQLFIDYNADIRDDINNNGISIDAYKTTKSLIGG